MRDLTIQDLTLTDQIVGVENARLDNGGPNLQGLTMKGLSNANILHFFCKVLILLVSEGTKGRTLTHDCLTHVRS